jgi:hypothetical protein
VEDIAMQSGSQQVIVVRCAAEYRRWLEEQSSSTRRNVAQFIDYALVELARRDGLQPPPDRLASKTTEYPAEGM